MELDWLNHSLTKYVAATFVGYFIAVLANLTVQIHTNRQSRRVLRESLAEEIVGNLYVLDEVAETLTSNLALERMSTFRFPLSRLSTVVFSQCMHPTLASLLSEGERLQAGTALLQAESTNQRLDNVRDLVRSLATVGPSPRNFQPTRHELAAAEIQNFVDRTLPPVGQNHTDLLCQVLSKQLTFNSTRMIRIATNLKPAINHGWPNIPRLWRTGMVGDGTLRSTHVVWVNDRPDALGTGANVVELRPAIDQDRALTRSRSMMERMPRRIHKRWMLKRLASEETWLSPSEDAHIIVPRSLSKSISSKQQPSTPESREG